MEKTTQPITIILDKNSGLDKILHYGIQLCIAFKKKLQIIVLENFEPFGPGDLESNILERVQKLCDKKISCVDILLVEKLRDIHTSVACLIADSYLFVIAVSNRWIGPSRVRFDFVRTIIQFRAPVLVINKNAPEQFNLEFGLLPLDHKKESREKILWTCAFGKHAGSFIQLIVPNEKDDGLRQKMHNTLFLCKKTMKELDVNYEVHRLPGSVFHSNRLALEYARDKQAGFCIITLSRYLNFFHYLFGFPEEKALFNKHGIPVLLINPRKDLYVPCV
ncbi:MAG: hypothetical protein K9H64_03755 [Bacteroidales bacterium]|nr:hypothetical protein [Bacteroidales bacterium]MCF8454949.1 hypothetical protein [Bacteroidales bacterium]